MAVISIAGNFGEHVINIGDEILRDMLSKEIKLRGHKCIPTDFTADVSVLLGGGLTNSQESIDYYFRQMLGGKNKAALGIGVNPIFDVNLQKRVKQEFDNFIHVSVRDEFSGHNLKRCGINNFEVGRDIVFANAEDINKFKKEKNDVLLIPVYCSWIGLKKQIDFYQWLHKYLVGHDYYVRVMIFDERDKIIAKELDKNYLTCNSPYHDFSMNEYVISGRYHGCILALSYFCKLMPIAYNFKISELARDFNLSQFEIPMGNGVDGFHHSAFNFDVVDIVEKLPLIPIRNTIMAKAWAVQIIANFFNAVESACGGN